LDKNKKVGYGMLLFGIIISFSFYLYEAHTLNLDFHFISLNNWQEHINIASKPWAKFQNLSFGIMMAEAYSNKLQVHKYLKNLSIFAILFCFCISLFIVEASPLWISLSRTIWNISWTTITINLF
jgi:hypothetical protein